MTGTHSHQKADTERCLDRQFMDASESIAQTLRLEGEGLAALRAALPHGLAAAFLRAAKLIEAAAGNVIVTGMGKSGHIGRKVAATLASTGTPSHFLHPAEASHGDLGVIRDSDVVLAMSWSGETPELSDIVEHVKRLSVPLIAVTAYSDSALGQSADAVILLPLVDEACPNGLAPTTSTTMQLAAGDALAVLLLKRQGFTAVDFGRFHPGGRLGSKLVQVHRLMHVGAALPLIASDAMLSDGIVEMTSKNFGIVGVVDKNGDLTGVLTDGDVRRAFQTTFSDRPLVSIVRQQPWSTSPDRLASEVLSDMNKNKITSMFVVERGKPVGLIHIHDILRVRLV